MVYECTFRIRFNDSLCACLELMWGACQAAQPASQCRRAPRCVGQATCEQTRCPKAAIMTGPVPDWQFRVFESQLLTSNSSTFNHAAFLYRIDAETTETCIF